MNSHSLGGVSHVRKFVQVFVVIAMFAAFLGAASPAAAYYEEDDDIPGVPIQGVGFFTGELYELSDWDDVYRVYLWRGDTLTVSLSASPSTDFDLYLFPPSATTVGDGTGAVAVSLGGASSEYINFTADRSGYFYLDVYAETGNGTYQVNWSITPGPYQGLMDVYRFYNVRTGTHFYTGNEDERDKVIREYGNIYQLDGVAYTVKVGAATNNQQLHRFFNSRTGVHFYTASDAERDNVMSRYAGVFTYEGTAYWVSNVWQPGSITVYRFFNSRAGVHFYTASESEKNSVIQNLGHTFTYEGPAYYLPGW